MAPTTTSSWRVVRVKKGVVYGLMIGATAAAFLGIRLLGARLTAPSPSTSELFGGTAIIPRSDTLLHVLLALVAVVLAARGMGTVFRALRQPPVMGEVVVGILLGPSLLGRVAPGAYAYLFPQSVAPYLGVIAHVGVILFMFLVGLELDTDVLRRRAQSALAISHASIVAPFLLGAVTALWVYPRLSTSDVPFGVFCMFLGVSMSVTAFPVLARILTDQGIQATRVGALAISCAAIGDVTAWCLLALVVGVAQAQAANALVTVVLALIYVTLMLGVARPIIVRFVRRHELTQRHSQGAIATVLIGLLVSALMTESIGIHALFGAFLLGALIPHESRLAKELRAKTEDLVLLLLLPAFFAFTGMRTEIGLVTGLEAWLICAALTAIAVLGKLGGSAVAARLSGLDWRDSASLGILMNTRGLMELIVLDIGLELKVISPTLFAMLVIMAVVTTLAATPALHLLTRARGSVTNTRAIASGMGP